MMIVNTDFISGKTLQTLSLVRGSTVHSKNIGRDILSSLKTLVGGEIVDYTNMMNEARAIATQRMVEEAEQLGADAISMCATLPLPSWQAQQKSSPTVLL